MGRLRGDAESFFKHGFSVRLSIELICKTRKEILRRRRYSRGRLTAGL
jgi:hypothetical protein